MTSIDLSGCVVDPGHENWRIKDDSDVWHAAQAGVREAVTELKRREQAHRAAGR